MRFGTRATWREGAGGRHGIMQFQFARNIRQFSSGVPCPGIASSNSRV
jgi:hypothetical protein